MNLVKKTDKLRSLHSALKLEKSAISKVQKNIFCIRKSLKLPKILFFFQSENCIFGNFKLFSGAKIDFWPFLKLQIMFFAPLKLLFLSNFRALCVHKVQLMTPNFPMKCWCFIHIRLHKEKYKISYCYLASRKENLKFDLEKRSLYSL